MPNPSRIAMTVSVSMIAGEKTAGEKTAGEVKRVR
jgi:hypothetical protein